MMDDMEIRPYSKSTVTWENEDNEILKGVYTATSQWKRLASRWLIR